MIIHWGIDPVAFTLGPLTFRWYGILYISVFYMGYYFIDWACKKENRPTDFMDGATVAVLIGSTIGARLFHCFFYDWNFYSKNPMEILMVWKGGLASHGGALGIILGLMVYAKWSKKVSMIWIIDRISIPATLAAAIIRLGNFMNSENYGKPTDGNWGIVFDLVDKVPRHPTQLYESLSYIFVALGGFLIYRRFHYQPGKGLLIGYSLGAVFSLRVIAEQFKVIQETTPTGLPLNMGQLLSIPTVIIGFYFMFKGWTNYRPNQSE